MLDQEAAPWRVIEQAGWRLAYDSFDVVRGLNLPRRLTAERGAVRVRVIVDAWRPGVGRGSPAEGRGVTGGQSLGRQASTMTRTRTAPRSAVSRLGRFSPRTTSNES